MDITTNEHIISQSVDSNKSYSSASTSSNNTKGVSFKDELKTAKTEKNDKSSKEEKSEKSDNVSGKKVDNATKKDTDAAVDEKNMCADKSKVTNPEDMASKTKSASEKLNGLKLDENKDAMSSIKELNSNIEAINALKSGNKFSSSSVNKTAHKISGTDFDDKNSLKMDFNDAKFFINLVNNQQYNVQASSSGQINNLTSNTAVLQNQATQQVVDVSSALMAQLQSSMQTNKPFRIDFDNNIAVIMKVDKQGKLSADFIPGDKAVEAYLKANLPALQQSFETQNLPYSNLSYRQSRQDNSQEERNNQQNKEDSDE